MRRRLSDEGSRSFVRLEQSGSIKTDSQDDQIAIGIVEAGPNEEFVDAVSRAVVLIETGVGG